MLSSARIMDTKKLAEKNKKLKKSENAPQASPFSQLTLNGRVGSPQFSSSSHHVSSMDALAANFDRCILQGRNAAASRQPPPEPSLRTLSRERSEDANTPALAAIPGSRSDHDSPEPLSDTEAPGGTHGGITLTPGNSRSLNSCTPPQPWVHSLIHSLFLCYLSPAHSPPLSPRQKVLSLCKQTQPLQLSSYFTYQMVTKLGEGTFAEVFGCTTETGKTLAIKIVPVEGIVRYNNELQCTYQDVLTELVTMKELSELGEEAAREKSYFTENFLKIDQLAVCKGQYPASLLESWDAYDKMHRSENDRPDMFLPEQLYILMAAENAGTSLENYKFLSVEALVSVLCQVAGALAVGEDALELEHRDLHMSNVMVRETSEEASLFRTRDRDFSVASRGVKATIVDYTLSRMKRNDCVSYNDLERLPWLFQGEGDTQFDVYRDMKKATGSQWSQFWPYTNVLWLGFLLSKLANSTTYSSSISRRSWRAALRPLVKNISKFSSAHDAFVELFLSQI